MVLCYRKEVHIRRRHNAGNGLCQKHWLFEKESFTMKSIFQIVVGLGLGLLTLSSCLPTQTRTNTPTSNLRLQEYFPLRVGATWKYKIYSYITRRSKFFERRIVRQKGKKFLDNAKAIYSYDTYGLREGLRYLLKYPLKVGNRWLSVVGVTTIERYLITNVGRTVSVPAGTFKNCIVVRSRQKVDRKRTLEARFYFAPNVGFVKIIQVIEESGTRKPQFKLELVTYKSGQPPQSTPKPHTKTTPKPPTSSAPKAAPPK